jgi:hypothetical protein
MATPRTIIKNELFQAHEPMVMPRALTDSEAIPRAQQLQKNELFRAHEAMATPRD